MTHRAAPLASGRIAGLAPCVLSGLVGVVAILLLAAPGFAQTHTVSASPDPVAVGRVVYGCWTAPPGSPAFDWIVLVPVGSPSEEYVSFQFTGGTTSGCAALPVYAPGSYHVRYLQESSFTLRATSNAVTVVAPAGFYGLTPIPNPAVTGRSAFACWTTPAGEASPSDAIGLFSAALPPTAALATESTLGLETGCAEFVAPAVGDYEFRYLAGGLLDVAASALSVIPAPPGAYSVSATPTTAATGRVVYGCWTAPPEADDFDWVTLVPVGRPSSEYVSYQFTSGATSGCAALPVYSPGTYEVRYLVASSYTDLAASAPITAVTPVPSAFINQAVPSPAVTGRDLYACWGASPEAVAPTDAIGLFDTSTPLAPPLATRGTCGAESGCATFTAPAVGSYEFRFLSGGTLDVHAYPLTTIASPGAYSVTATPASGPSGLDANVCWTAPPGANAFDWVALVPIGRPNTEYVAYQYTGGSPSDCAVLPVSQSGTYEARYFLESQYTEVAESGEVGLGNAPPLLHAHEWKARVTANPQGHPQFDVGDEVTLLSYVARSAPDRMPANATIGDYGTGFVRLGGADVDPAWTFGSPQPSFAVYNGFGGSDGVRFDAAAGGRSVAMSCLTGGSFYANDGFKTDDVPVPVLACPGAANQVTLQATGPVATVSGALQCTRYLPEPELALSLAVGGLALLLVRRLRARTSPESPSRAGASASGSGRYW